MPAHFDHGASSGKRWMNCPASIKHYKANPLPDTKDTLLGTARHSVVEDMWFRGDELEEWDYDQNDWDNAVTYCEIIRDCVKQVGEGAIVFIEEQVIIEIFGQKVGGTPDCIVYRPGGELHVIDFKGGFEEVDVIGNDQLMIYTQAACSTYDIKPEAVYHHIYQPNSLGDDWTVVEVQMDVLFKYRNNLAAKVNRTLTPKPRYNEGSWCEWCNKAECPEWMRKQAETTGTNLAHAKFEKPDLAKYETDRLLKIRKAAPLIKRMLEEVNTLLYQRAMSGQAVEGHKLTAKLKNRAWKDEKQVVEEFGDKVVVVKKSVMSPAQVEKNFGENVDALIKREEDGYKLVTKNAKGVEYIPDAGFGDEELEQIAE